MPLEDDLVVGQAAVDDLVKMRDDINKALAGKEPAVPPRQNDPQLDDPGPRPWPFGRKGK
jgi:hypothetical protein